MDMKAGRVYYKGIAAGTIREEAQDRLARLECSDDA